MKTNSCQCTNHMMMKKKDSTQTGLYCSDCGKWIKWLGKKEINQLLLAGVKLLDLNKQEKSQTHESQKEPSVLVAFSPGAKDAMRLSQEVIENIVCKLHKINDNSLRDVEKLFKETSENLKKIINGNY